MKVVTSKDAPAAIGPYSQAVDTGALVFCAGQIPLDPATGDIVGTTAAEQAEQVIANIKGVLSGAGLDLTNVAKTSIFLADLADFAAVNEVYAKHFKEPYPARSTFQVAGLPKGARVVIEVIAAR
jgi:2-iminobutanoate/2-iminopropanoate deaminase